MSEPGFARVKEIFIAARERPEGERDAFLKAACGGEEDLRREVETLLDYDETAAADAGGDRQATPRELGPFRLEAVLGRGGMGEVYKAWDQRLERWVAIKHLLADGGGNGDAHARLRREAKIVAGLGHPAIVQVFDILDQDGDDWIVMELVDGPELAELLADGPLDVGLVLDYGRQIAAGLAAAHGAGIVHRDLKTENVMISRDPEGPTVEASAGRASAGRAAPGRVKILDFGLAKSLLGSRGDATLWRPGRLMGTPRAMSPEQARGEEAAAPSDLFSFGVLLYELLTARSPFHAQSLEGIRDRILTHWQPSVRVFDARIPQDLSDLVDRLLEKDPGRRPRSAGAVEQALGRISSASILSGRQVSRWPLAVAGLALLGVIAWLRFGSGAPPSAAAPAETLAATAPAETLDRRRPTQVISAWDHYLKGRQFQKQGTRVGLGSAIEHYQRALELDPDFALALGHFANAHALLALIFEPPPGWPGAAIAAAERALEIDPELPEAYRALGRISFYQDQLQRAFDLTLKAVELNPDDFAAVYSASSFAEYLGRLDQAVLLLLRSGGVRPAHRAILAMHLQELGFEPQARVLARQALEEEPLTRYLNLQLAAHEMLAGELAAARERLERLTRAYPLWERAWLFLGRVEVRAGRPDAAFESFEKASEVADAYDYHYPMAEIRNAQIRWQRGDRADARQTLERLAAEVRQTIEQGGDGWDLRWQLAAIEAIRGNPDEAVSWLEKAVDHGNYSYLYDRSDPVFESLRDDPRFEQQLERMRAKVAAMRRHLVRELGPDLAGLHLSSDRADS